jgi:signal transduction histidine kinase
LYFLFDSRHGSKQNQRKLFKTFTQIDGSLTRRYGGIGLGLAKAYTLVNLMGGKIWMESEENIGNVFTFTIPFNAGVRHNP